MNKCTLRAADIIKNHRLKFYEYEISYEELQNLKRPEKIEPETWMSNDVIKLLNRVLYLHQIFCSVQYIKAAVHQIRSLNDPALNKHVLRTFVIADGSLTYVNQIKDVIGSRGLSGINCLAFFMEMVLNNPDPYILKKYRLDRSRKLMAK